MRSIPSKSRVPPPSSTGEIVSVSSSTTPVARYCAEHVRSSHHDHVLVPRGRARLLERGVDPVGDELERRVALDDGLVRPVRDDEHGDAEARVVAPAVDDVVHLPADEPRAAGRERVVQVLLSTSDAEPRASSSYVQGPPKTQ